MHKIVIVIYFVLSMNTAHSLTLIDQGPPPVANLSESFFGKIYFYFSEKNYFTINSSKITYRNCPVVCSVKEDCARCDTGFTQNLTPEIRLEVTNYLSDNEKVKLESDAYERDKLVLGGDAFKSPQKPSANYEMKIHTRIAKDNIMFQASKYFLRNKNNYYMSDWLKSIKCNSMNFIVIVNDPKVAKTKLHGRFERIDGKLYLQTEFGTKNSKRIEVDESTGEMAYLSKFHFDSSFTLYTLQTLKLNDTKIPAINFCESFYSF